MKPLLACIIQCFDHGAWTLCWYEEKRDCTRAEICIPSTMVECRNWITPLGPWDPIPAPKDWPETIY